MVDIILAPIGFLVAVVCSMIGLGGGSIIVPLLVLGFGLQVQKAIGSSLFALIFMTVSATIVCATQKRVNYRVGLLLNTLNVPGAFLGAYLTTLVASSLLGAMFGVMLFFVAIAMIFRKNSGKLSSFVLTRRAIGYCMVGSLLSGIVSGMFGIGGGVIGVTVMIFLLGMPIHTSAGTALFAMVITTVAAVVPHWFLGNVLLNHGLPLAIGCAMGAPIGAFFSERVRASILRKILGGMLISIAIRMLLLPSF